MNFATVLASPGFDIVFKWSLLLALGWAAHGFLSRQHARARLILWRSVLCFSLVLPLTYFLDVPGLKIPVRTDGELAGIAATTALAPVLDRRGQTASAIAAPRLEARAQAAAPSKVAPPLASSRRGSVSWSAGLLALWLVGVCVGAVRLVRLQQQLRRLRRLAHLPSGELEQQVESLRRRIGVSRPIRVKLSERVTSPFVCGLVDPMILLPRSLMDGLSDEETSALLSHEIAHVRRHDLAWCIAWRWVSVIGWFQPLIWGVPAAHTLACEEEADRLASARCTNRASYARMLAGLALRVLASRPVETQLTLNGTSAIAMRLRQLARENVCVWHRRHSAAAFGLVSLIFAITAGCEFSKSNAGHNATRAGTAFNEVLVVVQDEAGNPIAGATVLPDGFRVKGLHSADAYHWGATLFGGPAKSLTDQEGRARVRYPVMGIPEEKEFTGALIFSVSHPDYATVRLQGYSVDAVEKPIRLIRAIHLEASAWFGTDRQPVTELVPNLSQEDIREEDWQIEANGTLSCRKLSPGRKLLQLMGRLASGEIVFSEGYAFTAERGQDCHVEIEMRRGIRLEGKIDGSVPRPVSNGRVVISVRPKEFPASLIPEDYGKAFEEFGYYRPWKSFRHLADDGSFVFESVPPGEVDVVVHGDGFVSKSIGKVQNRVPVSPNSRATKLIDGPSIGIPQVFPLVAPRTTVEVATEPTATLEVTATTVGGSPVEGATVYVNPNVLRMGGIFGDIRASSEEPFRSPGTLHNVVYWAKTGPDGIATLTNVPAIGRGIEVTHPTMQVPLQEPNGWRNRHVRTTFSPGITNHVRLTMEPKGKSFIGAAQ